MASLKQTEKLKLERLFGMDSGYVLDFSNRSFQSFMYQEVNVDIYNQKYSAYGESKAKRLREFWRLENDVIVGKTTYIMLEYLKTLRELSNEKLSSVEDSLYYDCVTIANRLQGKVVGFSRENTEGEFLKKEFKNVSLEKINIDSTIKTIIEARMDEIGKCIEAEIWLSAVILCGSCLEGILLGVASMNPKEFNQSSVSPKDSKTCKVKPLPCWSLSDFINVAHNINFLGLDVKKFSHALRDFRNYIHPYEQLSKGFNPDKYTALISWQVLQAAIADLENKY